MTYITTYLSMVWVSFSVLAKSNAIDLTDESPLYDGMRGTLYVIGVAAVALASALIALARYIRSQHKNQIEFRDNLIKRQDERIKDLERKNQ